MDAQEEKKDETVSVDALEMAEFETLSLDLNFFSSYNRPLSLSPIGT